MAASGAGAAPTTRAAPWPASRRSISWPSGATSLPVTVKFVIEGNEEVGSQGLFDAMKSLGDELLGADGGFYSGWSRDLEGRPRINGGMRGGVTLKVEMRNTNRDLHGAFGSVVRDPLMSLIRLLSRLVDDNGQAALPGFLESADQPSAADRAALEKVPFNVDLLAEQVRRAAVRRHG